MNARDSLDFELNSLKPPPRAPGAAPIASISASITYRAFAIAKTKSGVRPMR